MDYLKPWHIDLPKYDMRIYFWGIFPIFIRDIYKLKEETKMTELSKPLGKESFGDERRSMIDSHIMFNIIIIGLMFNLLVLFFWGKYHALAFLVFLVTFLPLSFYFILKMDIYKSR